jgi:hypothetical protein
VTSRPGAGAGDPLDLPEDDSSAAEPGAAASTAAADLAPLPRFRWLPQVLVALGCAVVAPFTALAWPFALFTGFLVGRVLLLRSRGRTPTGAGRIVFATLNVAGFAAMLVFGLALGGLIASLIVYLASESEKRAWAGTARQQLIARALVVGLPTLVWLLLLSGPVPAST